MAGTASGTEPVLHFTPEVEEDPVDVDFGSWTATHRISLTQQAADGTRTPCVSVEWRVHIDTNVCSITNAARRRHQREMRSDLLRLLGLVHPG